MPSEVPVRLYEGLFMMGPNAAADLNGAQAHLQTLLDRATAQVVLFKKWDERRLAYEVENQKRAVYFLVFFKAPSDKLAGLERDCLLSEQVTRHMVLRADHVGDVEIELAKKAPDIQAEAALRKKDVEEPVAVVSAIEEDDAEA